MHANDDVISRLTAVLFDCSLLQLGMHDVKWSQKFAVWVDHLAEWYGELLVIMEQ